MSMWTIWVWHNICHSYQLHKGNLWAGSGIFQKALFMREICNGCVFECVADKIALNIKAKFYISNQEIQDHWLALIYHPPPITRCPLKSPCVLLGEMTDHGHLCQENFPIETRGKFVSAIFNGYSNVIIRRWHIHFFLIIRCVVRIKNGIVAFTWRNQDSNQIRWETNWQFTELSGSKICMLFPYFATV